MAEVAGIVRGSIVTGSVVQGEVVTQGGGPIVLYDFNFDGATIPTAMSLYDAGATVTESVAGGEYMQTLAVGGAPTGLWYQDNTAPLRYVLVSNDFDAIATVRVRNTADDGLPTTGDGNYRAAGLAAHDPVRGVNQKNYEHITLGCIATAAIACEWKDTVNSVSDFNSIAAASGSGQIRMLRVGALFTMFYRALVTDQWTTVHQFSRPALPATLQVGIMSYASVPTPDIRIYCSRLLITRP